MDMQPKDMPNMHNTFWRDDQVSILFLSNIPILNEAGKLNKADLGRVIKGQPETVSRFLQKQVNESPVGEPIQVQLHFLNDDSHADSPPMLSMQRPDARTNSEDNSEIPPGNYPFEVALPPTNIPIPIGPENVKASFASFFKIEDLSQPGGAAPSDSSLMLRVVKKINTYLEVLNQQEGGDIVVAVAAPAWLTGGTQQIPIGQGCPLTPPMPTLVNDSCSNWRYKLPKLSSDVQSMRGEGVTVFILDSFPERGVIARAARDAGDDNRLLRKVDRTVSFDYSILSGVQEIQDMGGTRNAFVGKDVYGRHYPILMPDHGLFIAGIVRDIAPKARIECIRVLNDLCVGDANLILNALSNIYQRKIGAVSNTLDGKPVVINMSLVIPTDDELQSKGVDLNGGAFNDIRAALFFHIKALTDLGVVVAASAGNEGDQREMPGSSRPDALYPAKFCYAPYNDDGVIPVGAVNSALNAATYSCYPGPRGVATYGGEVPGVSPIDPPSPNPSVDTSDMPRGIYSSIEYPPLSVDPPEQYYATPDDHAWAYWVGTSFATPIVSALAARILQQQPTLTGGGVHNAVLSEAAGAVQWTNLAGGAQQQGNMLLAIQECVHRDHDEDDEDEEVEVNIQITEVNITLNESNG